MEISLEIENKTCTALLDCGSMISTVSEDLYQNNLSHLELRPLEDFEVELDVEGAHGIKIPYLGYIEANIRIPETDDTLTVLLLVVPSTAYHETTPVLLGTNIIGRCLEKLKEGAESAHTKKNIPSAWEVAHKCVMAYNKQLKRDRGEVGIVKSASETTIALQSNQTITLQGKVKRTHCFRQTVMCSPSKKSVLPEGVEVSPTVLNLKNDTEQYVQVTVSNLTCQTVVIPPSASLCQLQEVEKLSTEELPVPEFGQDLECQT